MRKLTIKKVQQHELQYLQQELQEFIILKNASMLPLRNKDGYLDVILLMDVAQKIFFLLQSKIQSYFTKTTSLSLKPHEAVVLLQCLSDSKLCNNEISNKFISILYTDLINLSTPLHQQMTLKHS